MTVITKKLLNTKMFKISFIRKEVGNFLFTRSNDNLKVQLMTSDKSRVPVKRMEDTKSLLVMVLQKVFQHRPKVVEDTYQLIYNYNNGKKEKTEYEKTLRTICDMMNDELPSQILVYLLTLVDMPKEDGCQLPIIEKMQKTHNCLPETVRPHLLEYLKNKKSTKCHSETSERKEEPEESKPNEPFLKPARRVRAKRKFSKTEQINETDDSMKSLLDLTANYVIRNEKKLKTMYKTKQEKAWKLINSNELSEKDLKTCYATVKDLNKKTKLLRMIENDNVTEDIFLDEYENSDVFLKERHLYQIVNSDPFEVSQELMDGIKMFLEK